MCDSSTSVLRLNELVAILAIHGEGLSDVTPCYHQAALLATAGEQQDLEAFHSAYGHIACNGKILCNTNSTQAYLVFSLPPGYPTEAAAECHLESSDLPRQIADKLTKQSQQQAADAVGTECLHELYNTLSVELDEWSQHSQQQNSDQAAYQQSSNAQQQQQVDQGNGIRQILLRLDHMRARASYSKTIKQWAAQLHLTGRLLFCQGLILILLEGSSRDISQYLYLARTVCVDVDSAGRKCCERMMRVLEDRSDTSCTADNVLQPVCAEQSAAEEICNQKGWKNPITSHQQIQSPDAARGSGSLTRTYQDFRELNLTNLAEVVNLLSVTHPDYTLAAVRQLL